MLSTTSVLFHLDTNMQQAANDKGSFLVKQLHRSTDDLASGTDVRGGDLLNTVRCMYYKG